MKSPRIPFLFTAAISLCLASFAQAILDDNHNDISDIAEKEWNGGELPVPTITASGDEDGDGVSNLLESIAGSHFLDGASFFRASLIPRPAVPGTAFLTWSPLLPQKQYTVFFSPDLTGGSWTEIARFIADGSQTGQVVPLAEAGGGFFTVSVADVGSTLNPGYTRHEMAALGLDPDVPHSGLPPAGGGGAAPDPNSDQSGPSDASDASVNDPAIDWTRASGGLRYFWMPVGGDTGGYRAIDMGESGHLLFDRNLPIQPLSDHQTEPIGKVWSPSGPEAGQVSNVLFHPGNFVFRMWTRDGGIVTKPAPWPMVNDDFNDHSFAVHLHSIGADGSVMANLRYHYNLDEGAHPEHPEIQRTPESGQYVVVWKQGGYGSGTILGAGRGFQGTDDETWTSNQAAGFLSRREGGELTVHALAFDHLRLRSGEPTDLELRSWEIGGGGFPAASTLVTSFPRRDSSPDLSGYPRHYLTAAPLALIPHLAQGQLRYRVGDVNVPAGVYPASITDLPAGAAGSWGIGDSLGPSLIHKGGSFVAAPSATGVVRFDKRGIGIGDGNDGHHLWINAEWRDLAQVTGLPAATFTGLKPRKITPDGLIWVSNSDGTSNGILVPVELKRDEEGGSLTWNAVEGRMAKALPGQKINLKLDTSSLPPGFTITGHLWTIEGESFADYDANEFRAKLTPLTATEYTGEQLHFYWSQPGPHKVELYCRLNGSAATIPVTLDVVKPESTLTATMGPVAHIEDRIEPTGGARFQGKVESLANEFGSEGDWYYVQKVNDRSSFLIEDNGDNQTYVGNRYGLDVLDSSCPYFPEKGFLQTGRAAKTEDTADLTLSGDAYWMRSDFDFEMYLMFRPPGANTRWVPLRVLNWEYEGEATRNGTTWSIVPGSLKGAIEPSGLETFVHPVWDKNWRRHKWVIKN